MSNGDKDNAREAVSALHRSLTVLRAELISKNRRIKELEDKLNRIDDFDRLFEEEGKSNKGSQTDVRWSSEPLLARPRTRISVKLKVPKTDSSSCASSSPMDDWSDLSAFQSVMDRCRDFKLDGDEALSKDHADTSFDSSVDELLLEAKDFLTIASNKLVTPDDWDAIKGRSKKRHEENLNEKHIKDKSSDLPFIPQRVQDLDYGFKVRIVIRDDLKDGIVQRVDVERRSVLVDVFSEPSQLSFEEDNVEIFFKQIVLAWK